MRREQRSAEAQSYHAWYKRKVWLTIREQQLSIEPLCRMCAEQGIETVANTCDHITPHKGDWMAFVKGPFQSLCGPCSSGPKQAQERNGYLKGVDASGHPLDPGHPWNAAARYKWCTATGGG